MKKGKNIQKSCITNEEKIIAIHTTFISPQENHNIAIISLQNIDYYFPSPVIEYKETTLVRRRCVFSDNKSGNSIWDYFEF